MTYVINVDIEYHDQEDKSDSIEEYAKFKKLTNAKLISYTRYAK